MNERVMQDSKREEESLDLKKKPSWLKVNFNSKETKEVIELMERLHLNTVCREANCPNIGECYKKRTATFMILGSQCTRNCRFCNVTCGRPQELDPDEPRHLAMAAKQLGLLHVVVTSVTRDDLKDGGSEQFAKVIRAIREELPQTTVEVLIPDFKGDEEALMRVLREHPDVLNHNVETVASLYSQVRPQAVYERSLELLQRTRRYAEQRVKEHPEEPRILVKTGVMLGLGETDEELDRLFIDLADHGVDVLTLGQYLRPSEQHIAVKRYVTPEDFERYRQMALDRGISFVASSPLVRSSYRAEEALASVRAKEKERLQDS